MKNRSLNNISLRWKFFMGFLIVTVVCILSLGLYSYNNTKKLLLEESYENMEYRLAQANSNLNMLTQEYINASSLVFMEQRMQDLIATDFSDYHYEDLYWYLKQYFGMMLAINDDVMKFSIFTTNQTIAQDYFFIYKVTDEIAREDWYIQAVEAKGYPIFFRGGIDDDGNNVFYLARALDYWCYEGLRNILRMEIKETRLLGTISEVAEGDVMMILDQENTIVTSTDWVTLGASVYELLPDFGKGMRRQIVDYKGKEMLMSSITADCGWELVSLMDISAIEKNVRTTAQYIVIYTAFAIGLAAVLAIVFSLAFTRRLFLLNKAAERMKQGIFGEPIEEMGQDEIGKLAETFSEMSSMVNHLIRDIYEKELIRKAAELNLIQEQVNPHFLYNALSSINSLAVRKGNMDISQMVQHLAEFYRISLNKGKNILTVREEVNLLNHYLEIQKVRFADAVEVTYDLDEELLECRIIKLILQPVVENAIHHAMREENAVLHIHICLRRMPETEGGQGKMVFTITDDGMGMDEETVRDLNSEMQSAVHGFGLKNIVVRINMQYGAGYDVRVYSRNGEGSRIEMCLPVLFE